MEPKVSIGILTQEKIEFVLNGKYSLQGHEVSGKQVVILGGSQILFQGQQYDGLTFEPIDKDSNFEIKNVVIGINFHWERTEDQTFSGTLKLVVSENKIQVINILGIEDYLTSVISSEMSATASLELLKAHAVISRSWLLAQIDKNKHINKSKEKYSTCIQTDDSLIKWYDREDHTLFDVCADDHCQRYQGIGRTFANIETVKCAIKDTFGEVLAYNKEICDARFSKCCGGVYEEFQNCWENIEFPYLSARRDAEDEHNFPDLRIEHDARSWILTHPHAFCNTTDKKILSQVLNNYDQETTDFYRWRITYDRKELADLIYRRSGIDYGEIKNMTAVERGTSGRIIKLKIEGSKRTMIIGKELEIRKTLSESHLYSSAFVIEKDEDNFILHGCGWGHGVGLCQIGAAVMGEEGYKYDKILIHYYPGAELEKRY